MTDIILELCAAPISCLQITGRGQEATYVKVSRATEEHLNRALALELRRKRPSHFYIASIRMIKEHLKLVFSAHPGITVAEACRILTEKAA